MKSHSVLPIGGLFLAASLGLAQTEILKNPDFSQATTLPERWTPATTGGKIRIGQDPKGDQCLVIENGGVDSQSSVTQIITHGLSLPKGATARWVGVYRLEDYRAGSGAAADLRVTFNYFRNENCFGDVLPLEPSTDWKLVQKEMVLKEDVKDVQFMIDFAACKGRLMVRRASLQITLPKDKLVLFSLKKIPPVLDGQLNDECWKGAQTAKGFMPLGKTEAASIDTEVMSCYDKDQVYFGIRIKEPQVDHLKDDSVEPWNNDSLELWFDPDPRDTKAYQLIVDAKGRALFLRHEGSSPDRLSIPVEARTQRAAGGWSAEIAIPFAAIKTAMPADNQRWSFNVARTRQAGGSGEYSSWSALSMFKQPEKFGRLAFYSRYEVEANMAYWRSDDSDPHMRRPVVSGVEIAAEMAGARKSSDLWTYDPFVIDREKYKKLELYGVHEMDGYAKGLNQVHPEFYRAALDFNRALVARSRLEDQLGQLRRGAFLNAKLAGTEDPRTRALVEKMNHETAAVDDELNAVYQAYGAAFGDNFNQDKLAAVTPRINRLAERIAALRKESREGCIALTVVARKTREWQIPNLKLPTDDRRLNADGASERLSFTGMRFFGHEEIFQLLGAFESVNWDWPGAMADGQSGPAQYTYTETDQFLALLDNYGKVRKGNFQTTFGSAYLAPSPDWFDAKVKADPEMLLCSQDGLRPGPRRGVRPGKFVQDGVNINHPAVIDFTRDYLRQFAAHIKDRAHFLVTGWEDADTYVVQVNGKEAMRSAGYNRAARTAFRDYLKERHGSIQRLNRRWGAQYADWPEVNPPDDPRVKPVKTVTGLTYEFERWRRVNHARYAALLRRSLKEGAPAVPVMADDSHLLLDMNGYLLAKENAVDIWSYHGNPGNEEFMWVYLHSLARRFGGKVLGYHENYWSMYSGEHLSNERLAKRDVRKFFFTLFMRDIRLTTWWLRYAGHATSYIVAYGGETFNLDYDQTILRWTTTELPVMFERGRAIEKALLDSQQELPQIAVIQPCSTIFNLRTLGLDYRNCPTIQLMRDFHYQVLSPWSYAHDYLPEEMVLDGKAALDEYRLLILPYAPYLTVKFSEALRKWVEKGGVLIANGSFGLMDEIGGKLPERSSLMRTAFPSGQKTGDGFWDYAVEPVSQTKDPTIKVVPVGKGSLVYLNHPIDAFTRNPDLAESLRKILAARVVRTASSPSKELKILVRQGQRGEKYLGLCNQNVEAPLQTTVTVNGKYREALDLVFPDAFPVPMRTVEGQTELDIHLDPGDWTLVRCR